MADSVPNYIATGDGPGLLLIHGGGGNAGVWWQQMAAFAATHRTVAYDLPGFGRTPAPSDDDFADHFVAASVAVLDAVGLARASVVGQSLGGWSALRLALAHPGRVERLVLCCTMAGIAHPPAVTSFFEAQKNYVDARGPASLALGTDFVAAEPAKAYLYEQISRFSPPLTPALIKKTFAPETLVPVARLGNVACPVLILGAEADAIWPPAVLAALVPAFRDARMQIIPGSGHSPYFEQPEMFNSIVRDFLAA